MNEIELLQRFRDDVPEPSTDAWLRARAALTAAKREMLVDCGAPIQPGRPRRQLRLQRPRRWAAGLSGAGAAVAAAVVFAVTAVPASAPAPVPVRNHGDRTTQPKRGPGTVQTAGFVLAADTNGTLTLTMSQVLDPAALQHALAQDGVPALVRTDTYCTSHPAPPDPLSGVLSVNTAGTKTVINPAAIPAGTELFFGYTPGESLVFFGLIYTGSYSCSSQPPPTAGTRNS